MAVHKNCDRIAQNELKSSPVSPREGDRTGQQPGSYLTRTQPEPARVAVKYHPGTGQIGAGGFLKQFGKPLLLRTGWKNRQPLAGLKLRANFVQGRVFWEQIIKANPQDAGQIKHFAIRHPPPL